MTIDLRLGKWQDVLSDIPDGSVRLLLTSPPYDNARTYEGTNEPVDFGELAAFALRVLCPGGTLAMVLDGAVNDGVRSVTPYRVICEWAALPGWRFRQFLVYWRAGVPGKFPGGFRKDHEPLLLFIRDGADPVSEPGRIAERAKYTARARHGRARSGSTATNTTIVEKAGAEDVKLPGSVWSYGVVSSLTDPSPSTGHPATFAEAFALDAVTVWSNPGDLVCDPFAGSATVGRACIDTGRCFIGAERVPKYHAIGVERLRQTSIFDRIGAGSQ